MIAAAIPDAMLLQTDECVAQEVPGPVYDGLTCHKYALCDKSTSWPMNRSHGFALEVGVIALAR